MLEGPGSSTERHARMPGPNKIQRKKKLELYYGTVYRNETHCNEGYQLFFHTFSILQGQKVSKTGGFENQSIQISCRFTLTGEKVGHL